MFELSSWPYRFISFTSIFSDWCDQVSGPQADWGQVTCGCHPNCGAGMALLVDKETKEAVPISNFVNVERFSQDIVRINDAARGKWASILGGALALLRNYDPFKAPTHLTIPEVVRLFYSTFGVTGKGRGQGSFQFNSEGTRPSQNNRKEIHRLKQLLAEKTMEVDFFQRCLAKSRGSTPEERRKWRDGINEQIREVMFLQGGMSIERMCQLVPVSPRSFY